MSTPVFNNMCGECAMARRVLDSCQGPLGYNEFMSGVSQPNGIRSCIAATYDSTASAESVKKEVENN